VIVPTRHAPIVCIQKARGSTLLDQAKPSVDDDPMRFPRQVQAYDRTCTECGYTWRVPRSAARRRFRSMYPGADGLNLARAMDSRSATLQVAGEFQRCSKCSADDFTQRAVRGKMP